MHARGSSWVEWSAIVVLLVAGLAFFQVPLKRGVQKKSMGLADYLLWSKWEGSPQPQGHKGDLNTFSASDSAQTNLTTTQQQRRNGGRVCYGSTSTNDEYSASSSVDETDSSLEPVLKRNIDLEGVLSYNEKGKVAAP
jgi:hypothetical protein